jgi:hypothetical protein
MPVEVLGLEVEGKGVGNKRVEYAGKILYIFGREAVGNEKPGSLRFFFMNLFRHREAPLQGRALGRPEWGVCAISSTLPVKEKASWLLTIDRNGIASHIFNAHHPKIGEDDNLPNLDHHEDKAYRLRRWV